MSERATPLQPVIVPERERLDRGMVILADPLSPLLAKGEITARYYNPGNLFRHIDLVLCAVDAPDRDRLRPMLGEASFDIHSFPIGRDWTLRSLFWRPRLLRPWAAPIVALAKRMAPSVVRCHHSRYNAFAAAEIKRQLGIPYVVSLHAHPETSQATRLSSNYLRHRLREAALEGVAMVGLQEADAVLPVYSPIVPWLEARGIGRYEVVYNAVGTLSHPVARPARGAMLRAINVGRQDRDIKDPTPIIEAVAARRDTQLTVVGNGPLHGDLVALVERLAASDRIAFHPSVPNDRLLEMMAGHDVMLFATHATEFSKVCIEAALLGVAIVHNDLGRLRPRELDGDHALVVPGTARGFGAALDRLTRRRGSSRRSVPRRRPLRRRSGRRT